MQGTPTLAMKMISAISQAPPFQNSTTPPMMVLPPLLPNMLVCMTGTTLAGM